MSQEQSALSTLDKLKIEVLCGGSADDILLGLAALTQSPVPDSEYIEVAAQLRREQPELYNAVTVFAAKNPMLTPLGRVRLSLFFGGTAEELTRYLMRLARMHWRPEAEIKAAISLVTTYLPDFELQIPTILTDNETIEC